jgi:hypothetical protein
MAYHVEWGGSPQDVTIRTSGKATIADAMDILRDLSEDERYRSGLKILIDHSELQSVEYSRDELRAQIDYTSSIEERLQPTYCAIVASALGIYGVTRVWEAETGSIMKGTTRLFRSKEDALAWLGSLDSDGEGA